MLRSSTLNKNQLPPAVNREPTSAEPRTKWYETDPASCFNRAYPKPTAPATLVSPAPEREGEGRARPEHVPPASPASSLRLAAGGESALPASDRDTAFWGQALRRRPSHLPACVPERRSQLGREAAGSPGSTANRRAPPSGLPAPSAAPPADGAPGLTSPGKRKRRETQRRRGPARRPRGRWVCPPAGKAASPSLRRARGSSHLRKAPGRHHGSPDAVTARGLCCAAA